MPVDAAGPSPSAYPADQTAPRSSRTGPAATESSAPIRGPHPQLVIAAGQIKLGEEARPPRAVEQRVDARERLDCRPRPGSRSSYAITRPVYGRTPPPPRGPPSRVLDPAAIEQIDELRAQLRELAVGQALLRRGPRHPRVACLELELLAPVRRYAGWAPPNTSAYLTLSAANAGSLAPARRSSASARLKDARWSSVLSLSTSTPSTKRSAQCGSGGRPGRRRARVGCRCVLSRAARSA